MNETLIIDLGLPDDDQAHWFMVDSNGGRLGVVNTGALDAAREASIGRRVIAFVMAPDLVRTRANLPVRGAKLQAALPYALEEHFAGDVEALLFAAGATDEDCDIPVAAIDRAILEACTTRLSDARINATELYALHDALPELPQFTQLLVEARITLLRGDRFEMLATTDLAPEDILQAWVSGRDEDAVPEAAHQIRIYATPSEEQRLDALKQQFPDADVKILGDSVVEFAARTVFAQGGINLLQGEFAVGSNPLEKLKPWWPVAAMAAGLLVVSLLGTFVEMYSLQRQSERLDQQIVSLLESRGQRNVEPAAAEPTLASLVNRSSRSTGGGPATDSGPAFLSVLNRLAESLQAAGDTNLDAVSFRNGVVDIRLTTKDAATLETLRQGIQKGDNLRAEIQRTEQQDGRVKSFMQIQGAQ